MVISEYQRESMILQSFIKLSDKWNSRFGKITVVHNSIHHQIPLSFFSCNMRYKTEKSKIKPKKGLWSLDEDQKLRDYVMTMVMVAGVWYLSMQKGAISIQEEETILTLHGDLGNKWSLISHHLLGRTENEIKNHWHSYLKKKVPKTMRLLMPNNMAGGAYWYVLIGKKTIEQVALPTWKHLKGGSSTSLIGVNKAMVVAANRVHATRCISDFIRMDMPPPPAPLWYVIAFLVKPFRRMISMALKKTMMMKKVYMMCLRFRALENMEVYFHCARVTHVVKNFSDGALNIPS
ncbi:myb domain protein 19 [Artemisia annua]|uniref:Myb domain protein 19 n=1 Tax=Artemisia annua TaxID=35608 RepID=A0A2U1NY15_ARTAN|nr:myb domain protein 19 [Artemisia annua]